MRLPPLQPGGSSHLLSKWLHVFHTGPLRRVPMAPLGLGLAREPAGSFGVPGAAGWTPRAEAPAPVWDAPCILEWRQLAACQVLTVETLASVVSTLCVHTCMHVRVRGLRAHVCVCVRVPLPCPVLRASSLGLGQGQGRAAWAQSQGLCCWPGFLIRLLLKAAPGGPQEKPGSWPKGVMRPEDPGHQPRGTRRPGEPYGPSGPQGPPGGKGSDRPTATRWRCLLLGPG